MREVFADTSYWVALLSKRDNLHGLAIEVSKDLNARICTTDSVLIEFLNFFSEHGSQFRKAAVEMYHIIRNDPNTIVFPNTRDRLNSGLTLYDTRPDKGFSLTDCISMSEMKARDICECLTSDHHFEQEGFRILLKRTT